MRIDDRALPYGALTLRLSLAAMWLSHAGLKYFTFTMPGFAAWLTTQNVPAFMAWPFVLAETLGGMAILVGFHGRHVSLILLPILVGALSTHLGNGWVFTATGGGWEYPAFLIAASIAHWLIGDGAFALARRPLLLVRPAVA